MRTIRFFDDFLVNRLRNVKRRFHQPRWLDDCIYRDDQTRFGVDFASVTPAPGGGYHLYYSAIMPGREKVLCLATSDDGLHWHRAELQPQRHPRWPQAIYPLDGEKRGEGYHVLHDPADPDPARRYKLAESYRGPKPACCRLAFSGDGIHFTPDPSTAMLPSDSDTMVHLLRNPRSGALQVSFREWVGDRRIFRVQSDDLHHWSRPTLALYPDPSLPPMTTYYGMPHFAIDDNCFIGMLWLYYTAEHDPEHHKMMGVVETELTYSYDGLCWNRTFQPFMPLCETGSYGGRSIYGSAILPRDHDLIVYAFGSLHEHQVSAVRPGEPTRDALMAGVLRKDGFVSLASGVDVGQISTDSLYPRSNELSLNVRAPFGGVRVQITDIDSNPLPGYTFDACEEIRGDHLAIAPRWREHADLSDAIRQVGQNDQYPGWLRVQVQMNQAELFAIHGDFGVTLRSGAPGRDHL